MSYFSNLDTIRDRLRFVLGQPRFGSLSGLRCKACGREFSYFKSRLDLKKEKIGLRCSSPLHVKPVFLTFFVNRYIRDLNDFNKSIAPETPDVTSPYSLTSHKRTAPYQTPNIMSQVKNPRKKPQTTDCAGIVQGDRVEYGKNHIKRGHRLCLHLACRSCCKDLGNVEFCPGHTDPVREEGLAEQAARMQGQNITQPRNDTTAGPAQPPVPSQRSCSTLLTGRATMTLHLARSGQALADSATLQTRPTQLDRTSAAILSAAEARKFDPYRLSQDTIDKVQVKVVVWFAESPEPFRTFRCVAGQFPSFALSECRELMDDAEQVLGATWKGSFWVFDAVEEEWVRMAAELVMKVPSKTAKLLVAAPSVNPGKCFQVAQQISTVALRKMPVHAAMCIVPEIADLLPNPRSIQQRQRASTKPSQLSSTPGSSNNLVSPSALGKPALARTSDSGAGRASSQHNNRGTSFAQHIDLTLDNDIEESPTPHVSSRPALAGHSSDTHDNTSNSEGDDSDILVMTPSSSAAASGSSVIRSDRQTKSRGSRRPDHPRKWPGWDNRVPMAQLYQFYLNLHNTIDFPTNQLAWQDVFNTDFDFVKSQCTVYASFLLKINNEEFSEYARKNPHATMKAFEQHFRKEWVNRSKQRSEVARQREAKGKGGQHSPLKQKYRV